MTLKEILPNIDVWQDWLNAYKKFVPRFIEEAKSKTKWKDWDKTNFHEFFERSNGQCVSSLQQGYFTRNEKENIKNEWGKIAPLLSRIANSQNIPLWDAYAEIQNTIRKCTNSNRKAATFRLIAALQPNLLSTIVNESDLKKLHSYLKKNIKEELPNLTGNWFTDSFNICQLYIGSSPGCDPVELITYPWQTKLYFENDFRKNKDMSEISNLVQQSTDLLKYKKQIIIQGPPGTGKTKLAKEIALQLIPPVSTIGDSEIKKYILEGITVKSVGGLKNYFVEKVDLLLRKVIVVRESETRADTAFDTIIDAFNNRSWEQKHDQNSTRRAASLAQYIFKNMGEIIGVPDPERFKIVQFHPSYTYEDFVKGIVAKPNSDGDAIFYEAENKILGGFAKKALDNYNLSQRDIEQTRQLIKTKKSFREFVDHIQDELDESVDRKYQLTELVYLFDIDDNRFKYKGDNWKAHEKGLNMKFSEIEKIIKAKVSQRAQIKHIEGLESLTKDHATYFYNLYEKFLDFEKSNKIEIAASEINETAQLKNYVLIIDEINRANLSTVLGELIYAMEYRGEGVDSIYAVEGDNQLILPPNLYIIGTMNTADRSVGHLDYAIRRRFAFFEVLPEDLSLSLGDKFHQELFLKVASLFTHETHLSKEFEAKDVQLGHSYFIDKAEEGGDIEIRLKYEVKPLLFEYVKDGILIGDDILEKIENL
jgi:5-methylcytosine-specific restriction protein B